LADLSKPVIFPLIINNVVDPIFEIRLYFKIGGEARCRVDLVSPKLTAVEESKLLFL